jgi:IclR family transcriptional regulator, acetate operon repressor
MMKKPSATPEIPAENYRGAQRTLQVIKLLAEYPDGADLAQIARDIGAPKSSTHRALATLKDADFALQNDKGQYRLGLGLIHLVFSFLESMDEVRIIRPILDDLSEQLGETAHYAVRNGGDVVYLAKVTASNQRVQMTSVIGGRNPLYCTGIGKALLAYDVSDIQATRSFVEAYGPLAKRTPNTIATISGLADELALIRSRGYAVDNEENEPGICCVALPVFLGSPTRPTGAVSVTALVYRTPLKDLEGKVEQMRATITRRLGQGGCRPPGYGDQVHGTDGADRGPLA